MPASYPWPADLATPAPYGSPCRAVTLRRPTMRGKASRLANSLGESLRLAYCVEAMQVDYRSFPILVQALEYWRSRRGERSMPRRADIDPVAIPRLLPYLRITEVVEGGKRFRYRLVGTEVVEKHGWDYTGSYLDEVLKGDHLAIVASGYRTVIRERRPAFVRSRYITPRQVEMVSNRVLMPLSEDGVEVNMILAAFTFQSVSGLPQPIGPSPSLAQVDLELL